MNKYRVSFTGRLKGALGVFYEITAERYALDEEAAVLALYDEYEHVMNPRVTLVRAAA